MQYLMLIYTDEKQWENLSAADRQAVYGEYRTLIGELTARGHYLAGSELQPTSSATTVRMRDGRRMVTDGPFAETREQLGGYFLVEAENLDVAIDIAAKIPAGRWGTVEVRPVKEVPGLPGARELTAELEGRRR